MRKKKRQDYHVSVVPPRKEMNLAGKNALVLGASRGIGRAIARRLAAEGMRLALPWFDWPESSQDMEREFAGHLAMSADLRRADGVQAMVQVMEREFASLHVLVNNIERGGMPVVHGSYGHPVNRDQWQLEMDTTLHAKQLVFEGCLHLLQKAGEAAVVNLSSMAAVTGRSGPAGLLFSDGYAAACRGVGSLTETWARLGAPSIRVNELMLGLVDGRHGPGTRGWELLTPDQREQLISHSLLRRTGVPEEVAAAVLFLIRDADFMTGSVVRLDGGYVLGGDKPSAMPEGVLQT